MNSEQLPAGEATNLERDRIATSPLRGCWSEPVDTFITDDIPLLLTKLSRIPASQRDAPFDRPSRHDRRRS